MLSTRLNSESVDYRASREELRSAELDLVERREHVATLRRGLPNGPVVDDYAFTDVITEPGADVRLSELFTEPGRALVIYHLMYGKQQSTPCPMCTMWIDGFNGIAHHLAPSVDFAVAAAAEPDALRAHAANRGWDQLRLLSCGENTFKYDLGSEDADGGQGSAISVFVQDDGRIRHTYTTTPQLTDDIHERGIDQLCAVWNILDLTPRGRGDWYSSLDYES
ncbi:MAG: DUF899 domain-containing protein [Acidimicrobiia bacterium]|jgi:predicted dithiol-disulfide oxidoreductase (DUF899 family)|nr:DUF899 domain-containing protein [Acidimicrobiia bacterium]